VGLRHVPLWLLALITFSGTTAMHIFVPALAIAGESLHASAGSMQLTVSVYIVGLALGQLIYGPLADHFGRRPTLIIGLTLFTVAGIGAAVAPSVDLLISARLFQALGGCAGMVLGRTMVRDTAAFGEAARRLALMNLVVAVGPGIAPIVGSGLAVFFGWRSIFYALTALGVVNLLFCWRLLPETRVLSAGDRHDFKELARNYGLLLKSRAFVGYAIGGGCATTSIYGFIAAAPFIFVHQLHRADGEVGVYLAMLVCGMGLGSFLATRLLPRVEMRRLFLAANALSMLAAAAFLAVVGLGFLSVAWAVGTMFVYAVGFAMASPVALTEAISLNPRVAGSASGLYGAIQMGIGALSVALVGLGADPALAAGVVLVCAGIVGQSAFWIASRRPAAMASKG
jgi:DHA1 family bicyclomycin/chloramphenicol resistance-like MFS transporter